MKSIVVQYRCTTDETADENQRLVEDVFRELAELGDTGFSYTTLRLEDGVSFVHVLVEHDVPGVDLSAVPAFQRFLADGPARMDAQPLVREAVLVGTHGALTGP